MVRSKLGLEWTVDVVDPLKRRLRSFEAARTSRASRSIPYESREGVIPPRPPAEPWLFYTSAAVRGGYDPTGAPENR